MKPNEYAINAAKEVMQILDMADADEMTAIADKILIADAVFVAGAGRSLLMLKAFAMRLVHFGLKAHVAGETTTPAIRKNDTLLAASGSGETETILVMAKKAVGAGAFLAAVTAKSDSSLASIAEKVLIIPAGTKSGGPHASWQPAGNSFEQSLLMALDGIAMYIASIRGYDFTKSLGLHANLE